MTALKNYFFSLSLQIVNIITPLVTLPLLIKSLGKHGLGKIAIISSITSYFLILGSLGLTAYGNKVIAKDTNKPNLTDAFNRILNLQLLYTTISLVLFFAYTAFFGLELKSILLISSLQLMASYFDFSWFFYGINEIKTIAIRNIILKILGILLIFFFVRTVDDTYTYFLILGVGSFAANLSMLMVLKSKIDFKKISFGLRVNKQDLSASFFIILPLFIMAIYSNIDRFIILGYLKNFDSVGIYDIGMRFISIFAVLIISLRPLMISKIASHGNDKDKIQELVFTSISLVLYLTIPICILLIANIESFIELFLGNKFVQSAFIIKVLAIQILLTGIGDVFVNQILISIGQEKKVFWIMCCLCVLLSILYLILIPILGIFGAAIGSVVAHFLILFLEFYFVNKYVKVEVHFTEILKCILAGLVCAIILYIIYNIYLINSYLRLSMVTVLTIMIYVLICHIFKLKFQFKIIKLIKTTLLTK